MDDPRTRVLRETFHVPAACEDVFVLFTPRGERAWAEGWDPQFPAAVADDSKQGTVFEVVHGDVRSTWIVSRCEPPHLIQYARATPQRTAGLITVTCVPHGSDETAVSVEYHLTALAPGGVEELARFAAQYVEFIAHWRSAIATLYERAG